jgi:hypothetical protein
LSHTVHKGAALGYTEAALNKVIKIIKPKSLTGKREVAAGKQAVADYHAGLYVDRRALNQAKLRARQFKIAARLEAKRSIRENAAKQTNIEGALTFGGVG